MIKFDRLCFDASDGSLRAEDGRARVLRPQVARLLEAFLQQPGLVLERSFLCGEVWGDDRVVDFEAGLSALIKELRQALRAVGASDEMLETVPRRGYRFHAQPLSVEAENAPVERSNPSGDAESFTRPRWPWVLGTAAALLVSIGLIGSLWFDSVRPADPASAPESDGVGLVVIPFELLGSPLDGQGNLDLVLADTLLASLWNADLEGLVLLGRTSLGGDLARQAQTEYVARELGASLILEGSLIPSADASNLGSWRIEARLLRLPRGTVEWAATLSEPAGTPVDPVVVAERLVNDLAAHLTEVGLVTDATN